MDWKFFIAQLIAAGTIIVATIAAQAIKQRYKRLGSLGVSQSMKERLSATTLATLAFLAVAIPLGMSINIAYNFYVYVVKSPNAPVTRNDAAVISFWVFFFFVLLVQSFYNSRLMLRSYKESQKEKQEREFRARHDAELKPISDAIKKLREKLDEPLPALPEKEVKSQPPEGKP